MRSFLTFVICTLVCSFSPFRRRRRRPPPVVVASKIDTEGALLGNMILSMLGAHGIAVRNRLQLGPTNIVRAAILAGQIDIYPEYTGNGALFFHMETGPGVEEPGARLCRDRQRSTARRTI